MSHLPSFFPKFSIPSQSTSLFIRQACQTGGQWATCLTNLTCLSYTGKEENGLQTCSWLAWLPANLEERIVAAGLSSINYWLRNTVLGKGREKDGFFPIRPDRLVASISQQSETPQVVLTRFFPQMNLVSLNQLKAVMRHHIPTLFVFA